MATIADHLNIAANRVTGAREGAVLPGFAKLGFEVELERHDNNDWPEVDGWDRTHDGSLRGNSTEYIFSGPQGGARAEQSIAALHAAMEASPPQPTFRCSTHCHMDVRALDWNKYEKLVLAYMVFEDAFFDQQDRYRRNSNFCIPFLNNDWFSSHFGRNVLGQKDEQMKFQGISRWSKYSALNLNVTAVHGSVEFRGAEAMYTKEKLTALGLRMLSLRKIAVDHADMAHLDYINFLAQQGINAMFIPGSFPQEYVMDEGGLAAGLSSALNAITVGELEGNEEAREAARREAERVRRQQEEEQRRQRARQLEVRAALQVTVTRSRQGHDAVNIPLATGDTNLRQVLNTVIALRAVGVQANITNLVVPTPAALGAIRIIIDDIELARSYVQGLTRDMLAPVEEPELF